MKTHTKTYNTWTIDDHPNPGAVYDWIRDNWHDLYTWHDENVESLKGFCDHFSLTDLDYSVSTYGYSYATAKLPNPHWNDEIAELSGVRLWKYLNNSGLLTYWNEYQNKYEDLLSCNGPFTGYCFDESLLDPIREFMKKPSNITFNDLIADCLSAWVKAYVSDWEYAYTDEGLKELCQCNDYEFEEDGTFYG